MRKHLSPTAAFPTLRASQSVTRKWRCVYRVYGLRQVRMGIDPIDGIFLESEFPKMVHGPIRPHYLHAPNVVLLHWR